MITATWNGFTRYFDSAIAAEEWIAALESFDSVDADLAERVAFAGDNWCAVYAEVK
jgi:hypothetical protein